MNNCYLFILPCVLLLCHHSFEMFALKGHHIRAALSPVLPEPRSNFPRSFSPETCYFVSPVFECIGWYVTTCDQLLLVKSSYTLSYHHILPYHHVVHVPYTVHTTIVWSKPRMIVTRSQECMSLEIWKEGSRVPSYTSQVECMWSWSVWCTFYQLIETKIDVRSCGVDFSFWIGSRDVCFS